MIKKLLILPFLLFSLIAFSQNVAINSDGSAPDNSAALDIKTTTKGMLIPRMTQTERNAIVSPANGLFIYQTDNTNGQLSSNIAPLISQLILEEHRRR